MSLRPTVVALLALVALPMSPAQAAPAAPTLLPHWMLVGNPTSADDNTVSVIHGMATISTSDVWAVGDGSVTPGALTEHWNGSVWSVVNNPTISGSVELFDVAAVASNNVWAVGEQGTQNPKTLIEHWNGSSWSVVTSPNEGDAFVDNYFYGVAVISANNIWAVGSYVDTAYQTLIEHWNGSSWSIVSSPNFGGANAANNNLLDVSAISASDIWAVGYYLDPTTFAFRTLTEHWKGTAWSIVTSPNAGSDQNAPNQLYSVAAISASNVWAVGSYHDNAIGGYEQTLIEHWNGSTWSVTPSPNPSTTWYTFLRGVAGNSASNVWAVGYTHTPYAQTLIEHWNGSTWSIVNSPNINGTVDDNELNAVAVVSANAVWAGDEHTYTSDLTMHTLIEGYGWISGSFPSMLTPGSRMR